jgi:hypothetical protein
MEERSSRSPLHSHLRPPPLGGGIEWGVASQTVRGERERERGWNEEENGSGVYIPLDSVDRTLSGATRLCPV